MSATIGVTSDVTSGVTTSSRSIPSLDGLRALSILLVIFSHYAGTYGAPISTSVETLVAWGGLGVRVFFVISGFLITTLLLAEARKTGTVNLRAFYWRRSLRIFPPYYAYIAVVFIAGLVGAIPVNVRAIPEAMLYLTNYLDHGGWYLGHSWSLSVEEQFYLLWPAAMLFVGMKRGWTVALIVVVLCPIIRLAEYQMFGESRINRRFETTSDALAVGCLLAYSQNWLATSALYARLRRNKAVYALPVLAVAASALDNHPHVAYLFGWTITNVSIALLIDWCARDADTLLGRLLNVSAVRLIGRMSYSIYLWQELYLVRGSNAWTAHSPINLVLVLCTAALSYALIEQPVLRWRQRREGERRSAVDLVKETVPRAA